MSNANTEREQGYTQHTKAEPQQQQQQSSTMTSLAEIQRLQDRYPFQEDELEILLRAHKSLLLEEDVKNKSIVMKLAMSSPYSYFFLPGDEMKKRVDFIHDFVLPKDFEIYLEKSLLESSEGVVFGSYEAMDEEHAKLEQFLNGVANTGRRGPREAIRVLYNLVPKPASPKNLVELAFRLALASNILVTTDFNQAQAEDRIKHMATATEPLLKSLMTTSQKMYNQQEGLPEDNEVVTELTGPVLDFWNTKGHLVFRDWVEECVPLLPSTLSSFVHNLVFHSHPYPPSRTPYSYPMLDHASDIVGQDDQAALLFPLSCTSFHLNGKWHRLYSSEMDGRSFNRLEWSLMGYSGPTLVLIQTQDEQHTVLGGFASQPWKSCSKFHGDSDCFLFQLHPTLQVMRATDEKHHNFMYCNPESKTTLDQTKAYLAHGLGFGGTAEKPRLFLPTNLDDTCVAQYLDKTFQNGHLVPLESLEKFTLGHLEVWGVGGDAVIQSALRHRAEHRETMDSALLKARKVTDKSQFATDMQSGLIYNKTFAHQEATRGRADFEVDEQHGGYKLDHKL